MATSFRNLEGKTFGSISVLSVSRKDFHGAYWWNCKCVCGKLIEVRGDRLTRGNTKSCGCVGRQNQIKAVTHHGMRTSAEYVAWTAMKARCQNLQNVNWENYGGRGIKVCERWLESFENFFADMGKRPSPAHSLDRKNNDGNYEPDNCRWATKKEQRLNQRPQLIIRAASGQFSERSSIRGELGVGKP